MSKGAPRRCFGGGGVGGFGSFNNAQDNSFWASEEDYLKDTFRVSDVLGDKKFFWIVTTTRQVRGFANHQK
jgi:hypothetical protein